MGKNPYQLVCAIALTLAAGLEARAGAQVNPHAGDGARGDRTEEHPAAGPAREERSSIAATATAELAGYTDTDSVTVITPGVSATAEDDARGWTANGNYLVDIVSAASVDIVSTASRRWTELRHAGGVGAAYQPRNVGFAADLSVSSEPDYLSLAAGGRMLLELSHKTVNTTFGYGFVHDTAGKTGTPFSVYSQSLVRHAFNAGVELVLGGGTTFSILGDVVLERGDQKKPYRMLPTFDANVVSEVPAGASLALVNQLRQPGRMGERTPLSRDRLALSGRLASRFRASTLVLTDRLYADDWGLVASTTDARFVVDIGRRFFGWVHLRGHLQTGVSFWQRAYAGSVGDGTAGAPEYRTGDRELSPLVAGTAGAGVRWNFGASVRPSSFGLVVQADTIATHFKDALYVTDRLGELLIVQVEAEL